MQRSFSFGWTNLTLWVTNKNTTFWNTNDTKKFILRNESGKFHSSSLIAIIGPSGVGKTTFLASLAGKRHGTKANLKSLKQPDVDTCFLEMTGLLMMDNKILFPEDFRFISGYSYQDDIFVESLTVLEHFKFMNALKSNQSQETINGIIKRLSLEKSKNTQTKSISGGEKKRLALGVELLNNPSILFCDEPTTGLDSYNAAKIIKKLESYARSGKLIFVTIHQPSSQIFDYFTHVILIGQEKIFYQGERSGMKEYFESLNLICPINYNPADFYLKCVSNRSQQTTRDFYPTTQENYKLVNDKKSTRTTFFKEVYWLLWRNTIDTKVNFGYHIFQFLLLMITATILATAYSTVSLNDENFIQNVSGIIFLFTSELMFTHIYSVINIFPGEYHIMLRERDLYTTKAYFLSKILATIPRNIIHPMIFLAIIFTLVNFLGNLWMFAEMFAILFCVCTSGSILGLCISAIFTSIEYMDLFTAPFELLTMLAAGILIKLPSLKYLNWFIYLSPFYYTYESLAIIYWSNIDEIKCKNSTLFGSKTGKDVLRELGFFTHIIDVLWNMFYLGLLSIFIGSIGCLTLHHRRNKLVLV